MKVSLEMSPDMLSDLLWELRNNRAMFNTVLFGVLVDESGVLVDESGYYINDTGIGTRYFPKNLVAGASFGFNGVNEGTTLEDFIKSGQRIPAIKLVRAYTGLGLRESKDIVDVWIPRHKYNFI